MAQSIKIFQELVSAPSNKMKYPAQCGVAISYNVYLENNTSSNTYLRGIEGIKTRLSKEGIGEYTMMTVSSVGQKKYNYEPSLFLVRNNSLYRYNTNLDEELLYENIEIDPSVGVKCAESGGENPCMFFVNGSDIMYAIRLKDDGSDLFEIQLPKKLDSDTDRVKGSDIAVVNGSIVVVDKDTSFVYYTIPYPLAQDTRVVYRMNINGTKYEPVYEDDGVTPKWVMLKTDGRYEYDYDTGETGDLIDAQENVYSYTFLDDYHTKQYFSAESSSDIVKGIYTLGKTLVLFGSNSIEFYDRGDAESYKTWQRLSFTNYKEHGLYSRNTVASTDGVIFYVGQSDFATMSVNAIQNTTVTKVSPVWVDELLRNHTVGYGFSYNRYGHSFYCLELNSNDITESDKTLVYDLTTQQWHFRVSRRTGTSQLYKWSARFAVRFNDEILCGSNRYNSIFALDDTYYYEDVNPDNTVATKIPLYRCRTSPMMINEYKPFNFLQMTLEGTVGTAQDYQTSQDILSSYGEVITKIKDYNPKILLEISNDGGYTYGGVFESYLGRRGDYTFRTMWNNLGNYRQCVLKITYTEPTPFMISSVSMRVASSFQVI